MERKLCITVKIDINIYINRELFTYQYQCLRFIERTVRALYLNCKKW